MELERSINTYNEAGNLQGTYYSGFRADIVKRSITLYESGYSEGYKAGLEAGQLKGVEE